MPPQDTDEWGLPDGAADEATDDSDDSEVPSLRRQEKLLLGGPATR